MTKIAVIGVAHIQSPGFLKKLKERTADIEVTALWDHDAARAKKKSADEFGEAVMVFAGGAIGTLAAGWVDVANPVSLEVFGMEGHATVVNGKLYFQSARVAGADGKEPWTALPAPLPHAFDLFLDAINGKPDVPLVDVGEAADRSTVVETIYKAAARGKWLPVK